MDEKTPLLSIDEWPISISTFQPIHHSEPGEKNMLMLQINCAHILTSGLFCNDLNRISSNHFPFFLPSQDSDPCFWKWHSWGKWNHWWKHLNSSAKSSGMPPCRAIVVTGIEGVERKDDLISPPLSSLYFEYSCRLFSTVSKLCESVRMIRVG